MALRTSRAASSLASMEACSLYQDVWGVQIRLGASLRGPWEKLEYSMQMIKAITLRKQNRKLVSTWNYYLEPWERLHLPYSWITL